MHPLLQVVDHRPWPLPAGTWIMHQTWNDLLFAHWPVAPATLRRLIPSVLALDTFDGNCWLAVTPFHMTEVGMRATPALPGISAFPELNVRTYVSFDGKPGVFFFSLDAGSRLASWVARLTYCLPYFYAHMRVSSDHGWITYESHRGKHAAFRGKYRPASDVRIRNKGTLEHWLTERYCLYTVVGGQIYRGEIHHAPWPLQDAEARIEKNTMATAAGVVLPSTPPLLHFAKRLAVLVWPLKKA